MYAPTDEQALRGEIARIERRLSAIEKELAERRTPAAAPSQPPSTEWGEADEVGDRLRFLFDQAEELQRQAVRIRQVTAELMSLAAERRVERNHAHWLRQAGPEG